MGRGWMGLSVTSIPGVAPVLTSHGPGNDVGGVRGRCHLKKLLSLKVVLIQTAHHPVQQ